MNLPERAGTISEILRKVAEEGDAEIALKERERKRLLNVSQDEILNRRQYAFEFDDIDLKEEDEEKAKMVLKQIAQQRYSEKPEQWKVYDTDKEIRDFEGMWSSLELRYPFHFASYVDSISLMRGWKIGNSDMPNVVDVVFIRGSNILCSSSGRKDLDKQAQQIYEQIRKSLSR